MDKTILVVDDDKMNLRRTRLILEKRYDILTTESGQEALDILQRPQAENGRAHGRTPLTTG